MQRNLRLFLTLVTCSHVTWHKVIFSIVTQLNQGTEWLKFVQNGGWKKPSAPKTELFQTHAVFSKECLKMGAAWSSHYWSQGPRFQIWSGALTKRTNPRRMAEAEQTCRKFPVLWNQKTSSWNFQCHFVQLRLTSGHICVVFVQMFWVLIDKRKCGCAHWPRFIEKVSQKVCPEGKRFGPWFFTFLLWIPIMGSFGHRNERR